MYNVEKYVRILEGGKMEDIIKRIYDYSLEEIMGERFGSYSKYIIQDRAIPDVRDGLKPVQRRILFSMYKEKNTFDKPYRKSARAVGDVMGKYHPHGDSSIYEAIVRMSQDWKMKEPFADMQGNNGSIDGDSAAASRYTEVRLSKIADEMLRDIDKDTVVMAPNYDDSLLEPTVLPSRFPNLLVNGTTGISAGYATNIPPHNLGEVIDATLYRIDNPNSRLDTIMNFIKGPDFPTGGIIEGIDGIKSAYETGRGKIVVKSRVIKEKNKIIITEIPYEVNKALLVRKMDEIRIDKKIDGILEVRDESDKDGLQIAIDVKKDANMDNIINYFYKNTDMQVSYNFNDVVISNRRPMLMGLLGILDAYIAHQEEIVLRRSEFDLRTAKTRYHIVEGLIKAISILDDVIKTIREANPKRIVVVFGCGGNRSKQRRYDCGKIAGELADLCILTADNPRYEDNDDIIEDILKTLKPTGGEYVIIPDRKDAIKYSIVNAKEGDVVMILGKGHEDYQEINGVRYPFDERVIIKEILDSLTEDERKNL